MSAATLREHGAPVGEVAGDRLVAVAVPSGVVGLHPHAQPEQRPGVPRAPLRLRPGQPVHHRPPGRGDVTLAERDHRGDVPQRQRELDVPGIAHLAACFAQFMCRLVIPAAHRGEFRAQALQGGAEHRPRAARQAPGRVISSASSQRPSRNSGSAALPTRYEPRLRDMPARAASAIPACAISTAAACRPSISRTSDRFDVGAQCDARPLGGAELRFLREDGCRRVPAAATLARPARTAPSASPQPVAERRQACFRRVQVGQRGAEGDRRVGLGLPRADRARRVERESARSARIPPGRPRASACRPAWRAAPRASG